jgi:hypothetical protein
VKRIAWTRSVECSISEILSQRRYVCNILGVEISVAVFGIQRHIHRMGIALHLGGSMSSVPHVRLPLDALVLDSGQFHNKDGVQTSGYRKVMVCLYNPLDTHLFIREDKTHSSFHVARPSAALQLK